MNKIFEDKDIPLLYQVEFIKNEMNSHRTDGAHPTGKGSKFMATVILTYLK